jgi:hypothetical protein
VFDLDTALLPRLRRIVEAVVGLLDLLDEEFSVALLGRLVAADSAIYQAACSESLAEQRASLVPVAADIEQEIE